MSGVRNIAAKDIKAGQIVAFIGIEEQHVGEVVETESSIYSLGIQDWQGKIVWYIGGHDPEWQYFLLRENRKGVPVVRKTDFLTLERVWNDGTPWAGPLADAVREVIENATFEAPQ